MMAGILFVGVTTGSSLVHQARPAWQPLLGQACSLRGADIPLGADDETYLSLLDDLRRDNGVAGAVVTTHKVRLLRAGRARSAWLDPLALACQEVNAIRRAGGGLRGWATALTTVLGLPDDDSLGDRFAGAAQSLRPTT